MKQRTKAPRGLVHQTGRYVGMDFVDPPVDVASLARARGADRTDALASALTASQAILFDDDVGGSFAPV